MGNDQIESDSLEAVSDGQEKERWEIPLVVRPDMAGNTRKRSRGKSRFHSFFGEERVEGKAVPKRECPMLEPTLTVTRVEAPGQLHHPSKELGGAFFLRAVIGRKREKTSKFTARLELVILPMSRKRREVELSSEQNKQFDPGG